MIGKNHLQNLLEVLEALQWLIQPDTILTELPYDIEFICKTDVDRLLEWCRKCVSPAELAEGKFSVNKPMVKFFVQQTFPDIDADKATLKVDFLYKELHKLLELTLYDSITLNNEVLDRITDRLNQVPGESYFDKTKKRIKIAVALKWLQNTRLLDKLSKPTRTFVTRCGDFYGRVKKGNTVTAREIGFCALVPDEAHVILDDYEMRLELALMATSQELKKASDETRASTGFGQLGIVISAVKRLTAYCEHRNPPEYDETEMFKDTVFIAIVLNYLQDPYIKKTPEAIELIKMILPIYQKYKELSNA